MLAFGHSQSSMTSRRISIFQTAASSILQRVVSLACTLVQIPILMPYLGEERFGFWMVLLAIGSFFGLSDLGISSAFQNDVTLAAARGQMERLRPMFLTAQATLLVFAAGGAMITVLAAAAVGKATFFRELSPAMAGQAISATVVFVAAGACNVPLALSGRLAFGLHRGGLSNMAIMLGQVLTLAAVAITAKFRAPFAVFLLASTVPTLCCNLLLGMWLFHRLPPSPGKLWEGMAYAKHTVRSGLTFFALGASQPLFFAMGPLMLSSAFGPAVVTAYGLATRALGVIHNLEAGMLGATWPAMTEALSRSDHAWARRCLRRSILLASMAFCLPTLLFPVLGPRALALWSGLPASSFPAWIIGPVTLLYLCVLFQGPFYVALNAAGTVGILAISHIVAAIAAVLAARITHHTPEAIPAWFASAFALFCLLPAILQTPRIFRPGSMK